jgi:hypothetical protein
MQVKQEENRIQCVYDGRNKDKKEYKFDLVVSDQLTQADVYEKAGISTLVSKVLKGYHSTIFAYG